MYTHTHALTHSPMHVRAATNASTGNPLRGQVRGRGRGWGLVVDGDRFKYILHLAMDNDSNNDGIRRCRWQQFLVIFWSARGWGRDAGCGMRDAAALEHFFGGGVCSMLA